MSSFCRRLVIGAERGGAGKTTISVGLAAAWRARGWPCAVFKKGPDYIDSAWLAAASGETCRNLDTYLMGKEVVLRSFGAHVIQEGVNLVEGNRGLFDGIDPEGSFSTVELAKLLAAPVVLIVDCRKRTRTVSAAVVGCQVLDPDLSIAGVILNRLATARHERVIRAAIERDTGLPVLGAVPKIRDPLSNERRLGLTPPQESECPDRAIGDAARMAENYLDVERLWDAAQQPAFGTPGKKERGEKDKGAWRLAKTDLRIGYFFDSAFHFYYPENIEALERLGARMIPITALRAKALPTNLDGLYIGGGFPEECAPALSANKTLRESVRAAAHAGLPIYAECGGLMYLGKEIEMRGRRYPMAGVFPVSFAIGSKPAGHGYVEAIATANHPFLPTGSRLKGHEFHYARPVDWKEEEVNFALSLMRGHGFSNGRDGLVYKNTLAAFVHVHALGEPEWAASFFEQVKQFSRGTRETFGFPNEKWHPQESRAEQTGSLIL